MKWLLPCDACSNFRKLWRLVLGIFWLVWMILAIWGQTNGLLWLLKKNCELGRQEVQIGRLTCVSTPSRKDHAWPCLSCKQDVGHRHLYSGLFVMWESTLHPRRHSCCGTGINPSSVSSQLFAPDAHTHKLDCHWCLRLQWKLVKFWVFASTDDRWWWLQEFCHQKQAFIIGIQLLNSVSLGSSSAMITWRQTFLNTRIVLRRSDITFPTTEFLLL